MLGKTTNPQLEQIENAIQQKVPPQLAQAFQRTVTAGLSIMYSPQSHQLMVTQLTKPGNPANNVAEGAAKLVGELYKQSRGTMPVQVMVPAATVFMCEGLDYLSKLNGLQINPQLIAQATQDVGMYVLQLMGISQQQMHTVIAHGMAQADQQQGSQGAQSGAAAAPATPPTSPTQGIINSARGMQ
ncbi:MAG: hypothetical protein JO269_09705 [Burkholderiaceae bacterium]|nr:hypothetical protein [Burkholderiaceae bacterium]